jgi:WD40 repeat protein
MANLFWAAAVALVLGACRGSAPASDAMTPSPKPSPSATFDPPIIEDGARIRLLDERIYGVDFSPDGKYLAVAGRSHVSVYAAADFSPVFSRPTGIVPSCVGYSGDGKTIAYGTAAGVLRLLDAHSGADIRMLTVENGGINTLAFSPDGTLLAAGLSNHAVVLWRMDGTDPPKILAEHAFPVDSLSFSPDGSQLASGSVAAPGLEEGVVVVLWDIPGGTVIRRMERQTSPVPLRPPVAVFFLPGGKLIAAISPDGRYIVWDSESGEKARVLELELAGGADVFGLSPDARTIAVGAVSGDVSLYDAADGERISLTEERSGLSAVECVAFSPDGKMLASGTGQGRLTLWNLEYWR